MAPNRHAGFMFMCSRSTEAECLSRALLGLPRGSFAAMENKIDDQTRIFLLNFQTREVFGPFRANGAAALDIVPEAWGGKFPAQLRVHTRPYSSAVLPSGDT